MTDMKHVFFNSDYLFRWDIYRTSGKWYAGGTLPVTVCMPWWSNDRQLKAVEAAQEELNGFSDQAFKALVLSDLDRYRDDPNYCFSYNGCIFLPI